jgi:1,4-dihydroxy-2-naphthoate octaprenyltransferase
MTSTPTITRRQAWLLAARPRTLPAAVSPVLVGAALAVHDGAFRPLPALAALAISLLLQIGVNLANDYFDFVKGVDSAERKGPLRVTQSGLIPPSQVRAAMSGVFALAALIGVYLLILGGWPVALIGGTAILSALAYSGGPFPLASHGLGDLFVLIYFGLAGVCGTYYVQTLTISWRAAAAALPPGLLITAILVVNNLRDIDTDRQTGKRTLAVMLGRRGTLIEFIALLAAAYFIPVLIWIAGWVSLLALQVFITLPMALRLVRLLRDHPEDGPTMNRALAASARLALVFSALFAASLLF